MSDNRHGRVALIGTGGSISFVGRHSLDLFEYGDHGKMLKVREILERIPELQGEAEIVQAEYGQFPSEAMGPETWIGLLRFVHSLPSERLVDGIVILHGTSTIEESAYFLNLTLKVEVPVVLVGSQRPMNGLSSDGALNIVNAIRVAKSEASRGLGVLVVNGNEIHAARDVLKVGTYSVNPFLSPDVGLLGYIDPDGSVAIYRRPTRTHTTGTIFQVDGMAVLPRVDIACVYAGADGASIRSFVAQGARGIIVAGYSPGAPAGAQERDLDEARRAGVLVVLSAYVPHGRVIAREVLRQRAIVVADTLSPQKARILAMLGLSVTDNPAVIQQYFYEY